MVSCSESPVWRGWGPVGRGGSHSSPWCRMLCRVREGVGEGVGRWFDNNIQRVLGDGRNTLFWHDMWVGDIPLCDKFPRLFDLAVDKEGSVEEMSRLGWEEGRSVVMAAAFVGLGGGKCEGVFIFIS